VAAGCIRILGTSFGSVTGSESMVLYAGQPISAELRIDTSFHWSPNTNDRSQEFFMWYTIDEMIRDWLIGGPKQGQFVAKVGYCGP